MSLKVWNKIDINTASVLGFCGTKSTVKRHRNGVHFNVIRGDVITLSSLICTIHMSKYNVIMPAGRLTILIIICLSNHVHLMSGILIRLHNSTTIFELFHLKHVFCKKRWHGSFITFISMTLWIYLSYCWVASYIHVPQTIIPNHNLVKPRPLGTATIIWCCWWQHICNSSGHFGDSASPIPFSESERMKRKLHTFGWPYNTVTRQLTI